MRSLPSEPIGILPVQDLRRAVESGVIHAGQHTISEEQLQPASMDLRLGEKAFRLRSSFLPDRQSVAEKVEVYATDEIDLSGGQILSPGHVYLIPLLESLNLPSDLRGRANPRSSTGRLDIFTRLLTDHGFQFDEVVPSYVGPLYLEVFSRTFPIRVKTGLALNQLRLVRGNGRAMMSDDEIVEYHKQTPLVFASRRPLSPKQMRVSNGLLLSIDLRHDGVVGYKARRHTGVLDLELRNSYDVLDYWEPVTAERGGRLVLEPEEFYLLISSEAVRVPPDVAADMVAYDPTSGELRTHYAGFFDPGFGFSADGELHGTRAVLEVRAHDVPFALEHGQPLAKLAYLRMAARPEKLYGSAMGSHFQGQALALSRQFRPPPPMQAPLLSSA